MQSALENQSADTASSNDGAPVGSEEPPLLPDVSGNRTEETPQKKNELTLSVEARGILDYLQQLLDSPQTANVDHNLIVRALLAVTQDQTVIHPPKGLNMIVWNRIKSVRSQAIFELCMNVEKGKLHQFERVAVLFQRFKLASKSLRLC